MAIIAKTNYTSGQTLYCRGELTASRVEAVESESIPGEYSAELTLNDGQQSVFFEVLDGSDYAVVRSGTVVVVEGVELSKIQIAQAAIVSASTEVEDGVSLVQSLQRMGAVLAGKVSGARSGIEVFVGMDGVTERVRVTCDGVGNRSVVVYDYEEEA